MKRRAPAPIKPAALWEWSGADSLRIQLTPDVQQALQNAVQKQQHVEIGGFLLGRYWKEGKGYLLRVEALMPVPNDTATQHEFTFPAASFISLEHHLKEGAGAGLSCLGWYHTHPGHGIFFSEPDQAMHRTRFSELWQVGLVLDPAQGEAGFFYWRAAKQMGPVHLNNVPGRFDWATWQLLQPQPRKVKWPWNVQAWAWGTAVGGVFALLASLLGVVVPTSASEPEPAGYLLPYSSKYKGFAVNLPQGTWKYRLDARAEGPNGPLTMERHLQQGGFFLVKYEDIRQSGLAQKPARLWLQKVPLAMGPSRAPWWQRIFETQQDDAPLFAVDLPELWRTPPPKDSSVALPLLNSTHEVGRVYLRDASGLRGGDRLIEIAPPQPGGKQGGKQK